LSSIDGTPEPTTCLARSCFMRIREDNRNMVLLATIALCCAVVAGTAALMGSAEGTVRTAQVADNAPAVSVDQAPVRVIGTPFVPNVYPRER
jgi:hypothetical protein